MVDVANEAGVSQTTVSLVLNQADGARLAAQTRERVIKAAAKLGYQPIRRGGAPASFRATTIAFVCDEISTAASSSGPAELSRFGRGAPIGRAR
jgi:LacI family transcriptional regulator